MPHWPALLLVSLLSASPFSPRPVLRIDGMRFDAPPRVRLFVTDLDEQGRARPPSAQRAYQLQVNGLPEQALPRVTTVGEAGEPLSLVFVVQLGPSMEQVLPAIKKGIEEITGGISQSSKVRIIGFADQVVSDVSAATPAEVHTAVDALAIRSDALEMQLSEAVQQALKPAPGIMIVIADGTSRDLNQQKFSELGWHAMEKSARIHTVGYAPIDDVPLKSTLSVLSKKSKGTERTSKSEAELKDAIHGLADEVRHQRLVDYDLPRVFTGQQYDFQISVGDVASEPLASIVPVAEIESATPWRPIVLVLSIGVALALAGWGVMMLRNQRRAAAKKILEQLQQRPQASAEPDLGQTMAGLKRPREKGAKPLADPKPKIMAPPQRRKPEREPEREVAQEEEHETIKPSAPIAPPQQPPPTPGPFGIGILPRPTEFLRRMGGGGGPEPAIAEPKISPPKIAARKEEEEEEEEEEENERAPSGDVELTMPMSVKELRELKDLLPSSSSGEEEEEEESSPRFSGQRTQVLSSLELDTVDVAGWLVPLPKGGPTLVLKSGFKIGTSGGDFRVKPKSGAATEARFEINALGRWVMFAANDQRALDDGDTLQVGDTTFVYKFAARYPMAIEETTPYLQIVGGLDDGRRIRFTEGPCIIGSDPAVPALVRGAGVAPRHLLARVVDDRVCEIIDLVATSSVKAKLEANQEVQLGSVRLVFRVPSG